MKAPAAGEPLRRLRGLCELPELCPPPGAIMEEGAIMLQSRLLSAELLAEALEELEGPGLTARHALTIYS